MKSSKACFRLRFIASLFGLVMSMNATGQGRVVINEYMPWPKNSCGTTSEFVELLNFGPGPMNIGCYTITTGTYSVTIPANTILQPGQFFLLAGQNALPINCGNVDSAVVVDLNWRTCNCTNVTIPNTGDGFMEDQGANVKLVLLDTKKTIIDAVTRKLPVELSIPVTTSTVGGGCPSSTFDLDTMTINYETIGEATGTANSFARKLDGDCGWDKQTQISAHATNNTHSSAAPELTYDLNIIRSMDLCDGIGGSISIQVNGTNVASYFPMNYILAYDNDANGSFDITDIYTYGADSTSNSIDISNLAAGDYLITVSSAKGCNLETIPFTILACTQVLDVQLHYFKSLPSPPGFHRFEWKLSHAESLQKWVLEYSTDGIHYYTRLEESYVSNQSDESIFKRTVASRNGKTYYRLSLIDKEGKKGSSNVIALQDRSSSFTLGKNPVSSILHVKMEAIFAENATYTLHNSAGAIVKKGYAVLHKGTNDIAIPVSDLPVGVYLISLATKATGEPASFRFFKQ